jgi:hypothetical protein
MPLTRASSSSPPQITLEENFVPAVTDELIDAVNSAGTTWTAGHNRLSNYSLARAKLLLGTILPGEPGYDASLELPEKTAFGNLTAGGVPDAFEAGVDAWTECAGIIGHIRDQSGEAPLPPGVELTSQRTVAGVAPGIATNRARIERSRAHIATNRAGVAPG